MENKKYDLVELRAILESMKFKIKERRLRSLKGTTGARFEIWADPYFPGYTAGRIFGLVRYVNEGGSVASLFDSSKGV